MKVLLSLTLTLLALSLSSSVCRRRRRQSSVARHAPRLRTKRHHACREMERTTRKRKASSFYPGTIDKAHD